MSCKTLLFVGGLSSVVLQFFHNSRNTVRIILLPLQPQTAITLYSSCCHEDKHTLISIHNESFRCLPACHGSCHGLFHRFHRQWCHRAQIYSVCHVAHGLAIRTFQGTHAVLRLAGDKLFQQLHRVCRPLDSLRTSGVSWRQDDKRLFRW